ncbi:MAG: response regulator [Rhodospirillaceae bacterium]|nr:MAG: response regulator [Rhodospirillaceae bacterium]
MSVCLVVDDSRVIRKLAIRMLNDLEIETCEARNGAEALKHCMTAMPDIILLDWNMPILDGMGFLKRLRAMKVPVQPKVLFCTTESEFTRISAAIAEGADEYIMKPFDEDVLASKLRLIDAI